MIGCWYGVALLFDVFYEPFRQQIREKGIPWIYSNGTGLLDIPKPYVAFMHLVRGDMPSKMVIDMVYPILLSIGAILGCFLGFHLKYILKGEVHFIALKLSFAYNVGYNLICSLRTARTTLEHSIRLEDQINQLGKDGRSGDNQGLASIEIVNPFDQGYAANIRQILGPSILACLLPIIIKPPPPFLPKSDKEK